MALSSMTGFASADGAAEAARWHWEIRSVNARGLDIRLRLPVGLERLEAAVRERVQKRISRGAITVNLSIRRDDAGSAISINQAALEAVVAASARLVERGGIARPTAEGLLGMKGVLETQEREENEEERAELEGVVLETLDVVLDRLVEMRQAEGERLREVLEGQVARIAALVEDAEASPARAVEEIQRRLSEQVTTLLTAAPALDPQRLHQEAVILATKADIREEIDRLRAHVSAARELMQGGGAVGRKLDFLTQEFNREANTLCSKSNDIGLTRIGLELKAIVDQLREQVQNVE